ncbi:MAG: hypothetical protein Kow0088_25940 [Anaerolineales bacterium]
MQPTQTHPAQAQQEPAEAWFRTTLYSIGDAVITTDRQGLILQMNPEAERLTGWGEREAQGKPLSEIFKIINEETRREVENPVDRVLREGVVVGLANHTLLISRSGEEIPIMDSGAPIRGDNGEIVGVVLVFRDQRREREAQRAVEAARRYAEAIVDTVREAMLVLDADLRVVSANRSFYRLFQVTPADTLGRFIYELGNHQWDIPALRKLLEDILPQNSHFDDFEVEHTFEKIGRRVMLLNARRVVQEDQKTQWILFAIQDITEKKAAEQALINSERQYRILFENNPLPMWIYDLESLSFLAVNEAAQQKYGYSHKEFLHLTLKDIRPPEDIPRLLEDVANTSAALNFAGEWRHRKKDGTIFPVEIISHVIDYQGRAARLVTAIDLSEKKRAEEALRLSEERYHAISEMISDYAYAFRVEEDGSLVREWLAGNFEQITGYTPEESQARGGWQTLIYPPDMPIAMQRFKRLLSGESDISEFRILRKDGRMRWLRDHGKPIWDYQAGRVVRIYGAAQDITERKQRELELQALALIGQTVGVESDFERLAERLIQATLPAVPSAQKGSLAIAVDPTHLKVIALVGYQDPSVRGMTYSTEWGYAGRCFRLRKPLLITDIQQDEILSRNGAAAPIEEVRQLRSAVVAPLLIHDNVTGVISFESNLPNAFTDEDLKLLNTLASTLALVLYNVQLHEEANRRVRQLQSVQTVGKALIAAMDVRLVFDVLIQQIQNQLHTDAVGILLHNPHLHTLEYAAHQGFHSRQYEHTLVSLGTSLAGKAALERQIVTISDISDLSAGFAQIFKDEGFQAYAAAPLFTKGKLKGVLEVFFRRPFVADADWKRLFEMLADQAALAIENTEMFEELRRTNIKLSLAYEATIEGWSRALEMRDKETEGHTLRVTELTMKLAERLGVDSARMPHIRRGSILHDSGKLAIPDAILLKPGPLTEDERALMQQHPLIAYQMLSPIDYLAPALNIPLYHHERWDGSGYPRGLKGEEIPFEARIFAVADVWDALTSDRPYRKAWSHAKALNYIRQQAGKQFDPQVVAAFLQFVQREQTATQNENEK